MKSNKKNEWDLSPIATFDRTAIQAVADTFAKKWQGRTDYLESAEILAEALHDYEAWQHSYGLGGNELYCYGLRTAQDENNAELKAGMQKAIDFANGIEDKMRFFELSLANVKVSPPEAYRHFVEKIIANKKYLLSEKEEKIISQKYTVAHHSWTSMISGFLSKEERHGKAFNEIIGLLDNSKQSIRDKAAKDFNDILAKHVETAEHEMNAILANKKIDDELRGFSRPDAARHVGDDIDSAVVDSLLDAVSSRFDISQRFYKLKAKLLKKKKLAYHERNVSVGKLDGKYSYPDAVKFVHRVVSDLDPEFGDILRRFDKNGQIDVYPRKGKRGGAFCAHELLTQPTYILLNHADKLRDVQTLAHELGHGINNELMRERQNALNFGSPMATAEVASTFMEDFVLEELRKTASEKLRFSLMMAKLNDDVSSIFRQVACYRFEQELHTTFRQKGYLSYQEIGKLFQKHMAAYMGQAVEQSPASQNWWVYWSHLRNFFYVYSYASGLLISKSLQASVKQDGIFIEKVKGFLSSGMSDTPRNIFLKTGIDISQKTFWEKGLDEVEALLTEAEGLAKK